MADAETTTTSQRIDDDSDEDSEAQAQVIASLRAQVTDLFSQVTQLNGKLVASYDRMSDLEDQLHDASSSLRNASVTISSLELERSHHLAALNTGLLVEKTHVTAELNRLMERATEEAAQRGQAESARQDIEKDLDDLSASLFDQANTMVAEARLGQARSERKVQDAEQALKIAEDAVKDMQIQMQMLQAAKEDAERETREARIVVRKGKWVECEGVRVGEVPKVRFMTMHTPYAEFVGFVAHLRGLRASQPTPPSISTLLGQPFIARLLTEDSEPTVRLDLAPSLNWLSRRSVLTAIHTGMLTVEPWSFSNLVQEIQQHPQSISTTLSCALCGAFIARLPSMIPVPRSQTSNGGSWFKYPLALGTSQNHTPAASPTESDPPGQVYIFRLTATASMPPTGAPNVALHTSSASLSAVGAPSASSPSSSSRPPLNSIASSRVLPTQTQNAPYPLCTSNYCLTRLRSTCSLWAFVRVGIVERVWEEEVVQPSKPLLNGSAQETPAAVPAGVNGASQPRSQPARGTTATVAPASEKPPVPPRRRRLWEMASALSERAANWAKESAEAVKEKEREKDGVKGLPPPPPSHPSAPHPHAVPESPTAASGPPQLPKRNVVRDKGTTVQDAVVPSSDQTEAAVAAITTSTADSTESTVKINGHVEPEKTDPSTSEAPAAMIEEITFAAPPSPATSHPAEPSTPSPVTGDHLPLPAPRGQPSPPMQPQPSPPPPHHVPLPISRVTSPVPRPRSRVSSPATPPPAPTSSSRPASPAMTRSRAGSPVPTPAHVRAKTSVSSPLGLGSSRPASPAVPTTPTASATGPGAPPLPRRAAARRAVPPPPPTQQHTGPIKGLGEARAEGKEEGISPVGDSPTEVQVRKSSDEEVPRTSDGDGGGKDDNKEGGRGSAEVAREGEPAAIPTEAALEPAKESDVRAGDVEGLVNGASAHALATATLEPEPDRSSNPPLSASEGGARTRASMDTTRTKRSSSTDDSEGEGFASDTTWEERTWKELMRLKEDMFWARVGGVRALQGLI